MTDTPITAQEVRETIEWLETSHAEPGGEAWIAPHGGYPQPALPGEVARFTRQADRIESALVARGIDADDELLAQLEAEEALR